MSAPTRPPTPSPTRTLGHGVDRPCQRAGTRRAGDDAARLAGLAEQTAGTITDPDFRARALTSLAEVLARAGQEVEAARLAGLAEQTTDTITDPDSGHGH